MLLINKLLKLCYDMDLLVLRGKSNLSNAHYRMLSYTECRLFLAFNDLNYFYCEFMDCLMNRTFLWKCDKMLSEQDSFHLR